MLLADTILTSKLKFMKNTIIGAQGLMSKNVLLPLLSKFGKIIKIDKHSSKKEWRQAWTADVIWLSIPREAIPRVLKNIKLRPSQLVVDICSIKRNIATIIHKTGACHLSLHPLQGPFVPLKFQKWAIIQSKQNILAKKITLLLKNRGVSLVRSKSEDDHDFMMSMVLSLPELFTVVMDLLLKNLELLHNQKPLQVSSLLAWSSPAFNTLIHFYLHSINSSPVWLRKELILQKKCDFYQRFKKL